MPVVVGGVEVVHQANVPIAEFAFAAMPGGHPLPEPAHVFEKIKLPLLRAHLETEVPAGNVKLGAVDVVVDDLVTAFGIDVAQRGLWREATYRWERALALDPGYAAALNNLAVAYEHEGMLDKAKAAYERATALGGNQPQIQQNYDLFQDIHDRLTRSATP